MRRRRARGAAQLELTLTIILIALVVTAGAMAFGRTLSHGFVVLAHRIGVLDGPPPGDDIEQKAADAQLLGGGPAAGRGGDLRALARRANDGDSPPWPERLATALGADERKPPPPAKAQLTQALADGDARVIRLVAEAALTRDQKNDPFERRQRRALELLTAAAGKLPPDVVTRLQALSQDTSPLVSVGDAAQVALEADRKAKAALLAALPQPPSVRARIGEPWGTARRAALDELARQPVLQPADWKLFADVVADELGAKADLVNKLSDLHVYQGRKLQKAELDKLAAIISKDWRDLDAILRDQAPALDTPDERLATLRGFDEQRWYPGVKARLAAALTAGEPAAVAAVDAILDGKDDARARAVLAWLAELPESQLPPSTRARVIARAGSTDATVAAAAQKVLDVPSLTARAGGGDVTATRSLVALARSLPPGELRGRVLQALGIEAKLFDERLAKRPGLDGAVDGYAALVATGGTRPGRAGAYLVYLDDVATGMAGARPGTVTYDFLGWLGLLHAGTVMQQLRQSDLDAYRAALPGYLASLRARYDAFEKFVNSDAFAPTGVAPAELPAVRKRVLETAAKVRDTILARAQPWQDDLDAYRARLDAMGDKDPPSRDADPTFAAQPPENLDFALNVRARLGVVQARLGDPKYAAKRAVLERERQSLALALVEHDLARLERADLTTLKAAIAALDADGRKAMADHIARIEAARGDKARLFHVKQILARAQERGGAVAAEVDAAERRARDARAALREKLAYVQWLRAHPDELARIKGELAKAATPGAVAPLDYRGSLALPGDFPAGWSPISPFEAASYWQMSDRDLDATFNRVTNMFVPTVKQIQKEAAGRDYMGDGKWKPPRNPLGNNPLPRLVASLKHNRAVADYIHQIKSDPRRKAWADVPPEKRALWNLADPQLAAMEADLKRQLGNDAAAQKAELDAAEVPAETRLPGALMLRIAEEELDALLNPTTAAAQKELGGAKPARGDAVSLDDVLRELHDARETADSLPPALQGTPNPAARRAARLVKVLQQLRPVFAQLALLKQQYKGDNKDDVAARQAIAEVETKLRETIATAWGDDPKALQARVIDLKRALGALERAQVAILLRPDGELEAALKKIEANQAQAQAQLKAINDAIRKGSYGRLAWPIVDIDPDKATWDANKRAYASKMRTDAGPLRAQIAALRAQHAAGQPIDVKLVRALRQRTLLLASRQAMVDLHNQLLFFEIGIDKYPTAKSLSGSDTTKLHQKRVALAGLIDELDRAATPQKQNEVLQKYVQLVGDGTEIDAILKKAAKDFGWTEFTVSLGRTTYVIVVATVASGGAATLVEGGVAATGATVTIGGVTFESSALASTAGFLTEVVTFTAVSRGINQAGGLGNEKSFLVDLRDNFATFGALRLIGAGFAGIKQIPAVKAWLGPVPTLGQKALFVVAEKASVAASLLTLSEVHFYLDKGRLMNGDERLKAYATSAVHMAAGELVGLAKRGPRRPDLVEVIARADKSYQKEITEIAAQRMRLEALGKELEAGKLLPDQAQRKVIEQRELALAIADREAQLYARVTTEGKLNAKGDAEALDYAQAQVDAYGQAAAKLELELALLKLGGAHNANFKPDGSDVIVYRDGTLPIIRAVVAGKKNATITDKGGGRFVVEFDAANGRNRFQLVPSSRAPGVLDTVKAPDGAAPVAEAPPPRALLTPLDDVATANAAKVQPLDGNTVDLVVHASRTVEGNVVIFQGGKWVEVGPRELATWVRKNANRIGWREGKRIRLLVCDAGLTGLAQRLATDLKSPIVAADGTVQIHGDGTVVAPKSSWLEFGPQRGTRPPEPKLLGPADAVKGSGPVATLGEPMPRPQLKALAQESLGALQAKSAESLGKIRGGEDTVEEAQIGDGLAAAAVDRQTPLVIGAQGRWHTDPSETLLQTTADLQKALESTLGDPSRFAAAKALIPIDVITHLVDSRLLQAKKYVHGWAEATTGPDGSWVIKITPADQSAPVTVRVTKKLVVATGIPKELPAGKPAAWEPMAKQGKALLGDEVSDSANVARIQAAKHVVIVGAGGSAVSAANAILKVNPKCRITFVAPEIPASAPGAANGIGRSAAFRDLVRNYKGQIDYVLVNDANSNPTSKYAHLKGNKFVVDGKVRELVYDIDGHGQIGTTIGTKQVRGDLLVASVGRNFDVLPPPLRTPEILAAFENGEIKGVALRDKAGHYIGWEGTLPDGHKFVVTGSASRTVPKKIQMSDGDRAFVASANADDIANAGGNANTEFSAAPTVVQADRFLKAQRGGVDAAPARTEPTLPWLKDGGKTPTGPPPAVDAKLDGTRRSATRLPDGAPTLELKGTAYSGHEWATVRSWLAKQLGVEYRDVEVKTLKGGRSGALLFAVKVKGKDLGIFKIFEWNGGAANEAEMLRLIASKHLTKMSVPGERGVVKVTGGDPKARDALLMDRADGTSVEAMAQKGDVAALRQAIPKVARALAELHAAFEHDGARMSADAKRKDVQYLVDKVGDAKAKGYIDAATHDAVVDVLQKQLLPAIEAADLPATVYHGDANLGNFLLAGDGPVRVIDVGNVKWSLTDGKPSRSGAFDLGRFVESLETQRGKLEDAEVRELQQLFLDEYFKANPKLSKSQQDAVILLARIELEFVILRSPKADAAAKKAALARVQALLEQAKKLPPPQLDDARRGPAPGAGAKIPDSVVSFLAAEQDHLEGARALDARRKTGPTGKVLVTDHRHASPSSAPSPQLLATVEAQLAAHPDGKINVFIAACHGEGLARLLAQRHPRLNVYAIDVKDELGGPVVDGDRVVMTAWKEGGKEYRAFWETLQVFTSDGKTVRAQAVNPRNWARAFYGDGMEIVTREGTFSSSRAPGTVAPARPGTVKPAAAPSPETVRRALGAARRSLPSVPHDAKVTLADGFAADGAPRYTVVTRAGQRLGTVELRPVGSAPPSPTGALAPLVVPAERLALALPDDERVAWFVPESPAPALQRLLDDAARVGGDRLDDVVRALARSLGAVDGEAKTPLSAERKAELGRATMARLDAALARAKVTGAVAARRRAAAAGLVDRFTRATALAAPALAGGLDRVHVDARTRVFVTPAGGPPVAAGWQLGRAVEAVGGTRALSPALAGRLQKAAGLEYERSSLRDSALVAPAVQLGRLDEALDRLAAAKTDAERQAALERVDALLSLRDADVAEK